MLGETLSCGFPTQRGRAYTKSTPTPKGFRDNVVRTQSCEAETRRNQIAKDFTRPGAGSVYSNRRTKSCAAKRPASRRRVC